MAEQDIWTTPAVLYRLDNWTGTLSNNWQTGVLTSPESVVYTNEDDVSITYLSGSEAVSGTVQTSRTFSAMIGDEVYIVRWKVLQDGKLKSKQTMLVVVRSGKVR